MQQYTALHYAPVLITEASVVLVVAPINTTCFPISILTCCQFGLVVTHSSFLAYNSRLRSAIRRHHPPQRAVLSQICCFGERNMVMFQILLDGAEPCDAGTTQLSSPVCGGEANRILLASALSSMHIICPNKVSRRDWIIAVSLGCFVSLRTSSFRTNWYHLMPSSIRRHHWSCMCVMCAREKEGKLKGLCLLFYKLGLYVGFL